MIYANGYGFPRTRGGPMKYADMVGLEKVLAAVEGYRATNGDAWEPARLLKDLAASKGKFNQR